VTVVQRFACTQCGKCCNRSPEVELSEAAALSDVFVFRLMFRLYWLPRSLSDYLKLHPSPRASVVFYQKKRLLDAFAARRVSATVRQDGRTVGCTKYLTLSAITVDTSPGACSALSGPRCGIYERRPLSCRSVPFHYSRADALAQNDLGLFLNTPGYDCDTGDTADIVLDDGRIVDAQVRQAREDALSLAARDRRWGEAIARRMKSPVGADRVLPNFVEVEANAAFGATSISMGVAWQVAADIGLIERRDCEGLIATQLSTIDRELAAGKCSPDARQTIAQMRAEYWQALNGGDSPAASSLRPNPAATTQARGS
jgi:Fe-S-cluster containining protein